MLLLILCLCLPWLMPAQEYPWADAVFKKMSQREKIGQLFVVHTFSDFKQSDPGLQKYCDEVAQTANHEYIIDLIKKYKVGGVLFLCDSTIEKHIEASNKFQKESDLPLITWLDAENGLTMRLDDALSFPWNMTLGAIQNEKLIYKAGKEIGRHCKAIGVLNFAPVADVNNNPENPVIAFRSFGENVDAVTRKMLLFARGMQKTLGFACAKHGPIGHGDVNVDSHATQPIVPHDKKRLQEIEIKPFKAASDHGVDAIMTAHLHVPAYDNRPNRAASLSRAIVTELLKKEIGFKGLAITDSLEMKGVCDHHEPGHLEKEAFLAGNDILLCPLDVPKAIDLIDQAIKKDPELQKQLDASVLKILQLKERMNLHKERIFDVDAAKKVIFSSRALALKKTLFAQAITLLKSQDSILPLKQNPNNSIATLIINAHDSTFEKLIDERFQHDFCMYLDTEKLHANDYANVPDLFAKHQTVIVGIFGITRTKAENFGIKPEVIELIKNLKDQGKKVIVTLFGYAYSAGLFGKEDAIIMAYENDSDAQEAATDVIAGLQKPTGKLPISACEQFPCGSGL